MSLKRLILIIGLVFFAGLALGANITGFLVSNATSLNLQVKEINAKDLKNIIADENLTLINVHAPYAGEIPFTDMFINYDEMKANETKLPADKNAKIVLYCETGKMSETAVSTLASMGYTNVSHLKGGTKAWTAGGFELLNLADLPKKVTPEDGFTLPIEWGDLGPKLIALGVIDKDKFEKTVKMTDEEKKILTEGSDSEMKINSQNSQFMVDMLWALGLAQKSKVYDEGPMGKEYKKNVANFSSTGGWTLAKGDAVKHLNMHLLVPLTEEQQKRVAEIAKFIYRPCCGNPTWFPDCNHGMAALAAVELMVAKGMDDGEIYKNVLKLNSFWFSSSYLTTATYFERIGIKWEDVDAKEVLGDKFSSSNGAMETAQKVGTLPYGTQSGGSCGA